MVENFNPSQSATDEKPVVATHKPYKPRFIQESRLTLLEKPERGRCTYQCSCGNTIEAWAYLVNSGQLKSCGCLKKERITKVNKHLYWVYDQMKRRCQDSGNDEYKNYGGRGITICEEWNKDFRIFLQWSNENGYQRGLTIDRINNDGNYEPSNCRWTTQLVQSYNTRKNVGIEKAKQARALMLEGHTLEQIQAITGISWMSLQRIRQNKTYKDESSFPIKRKVKLTDEIVAQIRAHLANGLSQEKTAKIVGVSAGSVQHVHENRHRKENPLRTMWQHE